MVIVEKKNLDLLLRVRNFVFGDKFNFFRRSSGVYTVHTRAASLDLMPGDILIILPHGGTLVSVPSLLYCTVLQVGTWPWS